MSDELVFGESPKVDKEQTDDGEVFGVVNNAPITSCQGYVEYEQESNVGISVTETGVSDETYGTNNENSVKIDQANITSLFKIGSVVLGVVFLILFLIFIL